MPQKPLAAYAVDIPKVSARLTDQPEIQACFDGLTPGYQREWARYIYGAVALKTQQKHFDEMCQILAAGYKSKRGYAQAQKK